MLKNVVQIQKGVNDMKNFELAKKYEDYIISMRRYFHENPELSSQEDKTVERLSRELKDMGIEHVIIPNGGILATIKGKTDNGRAVLLRADIDALPVVETDENLKEKRVCKSKVDGVMHACGHDGHMAMLLGAAKILMEKKDEIAGTVYLCFERGEEGTGNVKYIFAYMEKNGIKVDSAYGIHLLSTLETGKMGINDTNMMAGAMGFNVTIEGRGGHGSRPDQSINPIDAFAAIYSGMQALRLVKVDPYKTLTYSVGTLNAGVVGNVIPQTCTFGGTMRTFDRDVSGMIFYNEFKNLIDNTCKAYNCVPTYNAYTLPGFPVINDPECAAFARKVIGDEIGAENIVEAEPWMASESFSQYLMMWPGVFAFLGMKNEEKGIGAAHHNQQFDIDEDVLVKGAAGAATYALEFLKSDIDTSARKSVSSYKEILVKSGKEEEIKELFGE